MLVDENSVLFLSPQLGALPNVLSKGMAADPIVRQQQLLQLRETLEWGDMREHIARKVEFSKCGEEQTRWLFNFIFGKLQDANGEEVLWC